MVQFEYTVTAKHYHSETNVGSNHIVGFYHSQALERPSELRLWSKRTSKQQAQYVVFRTSMGLLRVFIEMAAF